VDRTGLDSDERGESMSPVIDRKDKISTDILKSFYYFSFESVRFLKSMILCNQSQNKRCEIRRKEVEGR